MAGVDLATLKELMGHSSITTIMRHVHPTPEHKRNAVEKLEQFNIAQLFAQFEQQGPKKILTLPLNGDFHVLLNC